MKRKAKMSKSAACFIARVTRLQLQHGKKQKQAVAIAYSRARQAGYQVPQKTTTRRQK